MLFEGPEDLRRFTKYLVEEMEKCGHNDIVSELNEWGETPFSTSSEYLGELKLILEKVRSINVLSRLNKQNIDACIEAINKAFDA